MMGRPKKFNREEVLRKAMPLFWKRGFADTGLQDIEKATGVNKSGLYSEFESKEDLFLACLRYYLNTRTGYALLSAEPLGWGNIQRFLEEAPSCALDQSGCFAVNSMRELTGLPPEARIIIVEGRAKLKRLLKANIFSGNPQMDADTVCDLVSVFFSGMCIEANLNPDRSRARQKIKNFMKVLRTLTNRHPSASPK